jgi:hypothetical protein
VARDAVSKDAKQELEDRSYASSVAPRSHPRWHRARHSRAVLVQLDWGMS